MTVLPDVLQEGLKVVFCGTAVGDKSAQRGAYYAGPGNQFWEVLYRIGLTPRRLSPPEYPQLIVYGVGLTDLAKTKSGTDNKIGKGDFDVQLFSEKIRHYHPKAIAFNGKRAAETFLDRKVEYGKQNEKIGDVAIFVLPSTSGAARGFWDESYWRELAEFIRA
jgi:TDG/mug DNA glycosylase family protein